MNLERALTALLLAAALGAARLERASTLPARVRDGRAWLAWVAARSGDETPSFHLAVYHPTARRLSVLHVPGDEKLDKRRSVDRAYRDALKATGDPDAAEDAAEDLAEARLRELSPEPIPAVASRLTVTVPPPDAEDEPAVTAALALKKDGRRPRAWLALARRAWRGLRAGDPSAVDPLFFALELRKTPLQSVAPARLPGDDLAPGFLGRFLAADPPDDEPGRATTAEVLNATASSGLASRAAKMLRLRGVDVLTIGGTRPRARTMVFDRVGDYRRAAKTLAALGCPTARAVTRLDPSRVVDVSVELGDDCADSFGPEDGREP